MAKTLHTIDATGQAPGRIATQVAMILMGKNKPTYTPHIMDGDAVHIVNASKVKITGKKLTGKVFYRHSKYPGGLKTKQLGHVMEQDPAFVLRHAIERMLPKTTHRVKMLKNLRISA